MDAGTHTQPCVHTHMLSKLVALPVFKHAGEATVACVSALHLDRAPLCTAVLLGLHQALSANLTAEVLRNRVVKEAATWLCVSSTGAHVRPPRVPSLGVAVRAAICLSKA